MSQELNRITCSKVDGCWNNTGLAIPTNRNAEVIHDQEDRFDGLTAGGDSYHLQQARKKLSESGYLNALAQAIQDVKPYTYFHDSMRQAIKVDEYTVGVLGGQELGKGTRVT